MNAFELATVRAKALEIALLRRTAGQALPDLLAQAEEIETWLRKAPALSDSAKPFAAQNQAGQPRRA